MATRIRTSSRLTRQTLALVCMLLLVLMITGLPVPLTNGKDRSTPFICMESRCGCMTAEQCWKHCCCHTNEEKLAWARKHNQPVPDYVVQADVQLSGKCESCEQEFRHDTCCEVENDSSNSSCCEHQNTSKSSKPPKSLKWIIMIHAHQCQGHDGWSLLANAIVVLKCDCALELLICLPSGNVAVDAWALSTHFTTPESPPPKHL